MALAHTRPHCGQLNAALWLLSILLQHNAHMIGAVDGRGCIWSAVCCFPAGHLLSSPPLPPPFQSSRLIYVYPVKNSAPVVAFHKTPTASTINRTNGLGHPFVAPFPTARQQRDSVCYVRPCTSRWFRGSSAVLLPKYLLISILPCLLITTAAFTILGVSLGTCTCPNLHRP